MIYFFVNIYAFYLQSKYRETFMVLTKKRNSIVLMVENNLDDSSNLRLFFKIDNYKLSL